MRRARSRALFNVMRASQGSIRRSESKAIEFEPGLRKRVLHGFLGIAFVAQGRGRDFQQARRMRLDQALKGQLVSRLGPCD